MVKSVRKNILKCGIYQLVQLRNNIMKICKNCIREFNEREDDIHNPMVKLGMIFLEHTAEANVTDYCQECREELGILNVIGFKKCI